MTPEREQEIRARWLDSGWARERGPAYKRDLGELLDELDAVRAQLRERQDELTKTGEDRDTAWTKVDALQILLREREATIRKLLHAAYKIQYDWEGTRMGDAIAEAEAALASLDPKGDSQ